MKLKLIDAVNTAYFEPLCKLYESAFPEEEKKPMRLMLEKREAGYFEILAIVDEGDAFAGLAITVKCGGLVLLDYFAIAPELRGGGYGSLALKLLREKYPDRRLILEIESTLCPSDNPEQRNRRKRFYLANGMRPMPYRVYLFGVEMELMTFGGEVSFDEYHSLFVEVYGNSAAKRVVLKHCV